MHDSVTITRLSRSSKTDYFQNLRLRLNERGVEPALACIILVPFKDDRVLVKSSYIQDNFSSIKQSNHVENGFTRNATTALLSLFCE